MTYQHSLDVEAKFLSGTSVVSVLSALQPLALECGWTDEDILSGNLYENDSIELVICGDFIERLTLSTSGQVTGHHRNVVDEFAANLSAIAEPGFITFRDHDHVNLESAIKTIWYGEPRSVAAARRLHAWYLAQDLMREADVPAAVLRMMVALGHFIQVDQPADKVGGIELASRFMDELLDSIETLTMIGEEHGPRTLADLMYLQQAIMKAGFIDHEPGESKVLDLAQALPSGKLWTSFIKVEYLASPQGEASDTGRLLA